MDRLSAPIGLALVVWMQIPGPPVAADEASQIEYALGQVVPLHDEDLTNIAQQVMQKHPLVSSSSGIKFASAQRSVRSTDIASIVYFPHAESAGIKYAFQVRCVRQAPSKSWTCEDAEIRRYLRLESQAYEVRVLGNIRAEEAIALVQATRATAERSLPDGPISRTAIMIHSSGNSCHVTWGSAEGYARLMVEARLRSGSDPTEPESWEASLWEPSE